MKSEPVLIIAAVQAAVTLAVSFGLHLTSAQIVAISTFLTAVSAAVARAHVSPSRD